MRKPLLLAGLLVMLMAPLTAHAGNSFITERAGLRAGPGDRYPQLGLLGANVSLNLVGCLSNWSWCEVETRGVHGWVSAKHLGVNYYGRRLGVNSHGYRLGLPVIGFDEPTYWGHYYYDRDFYIVRYGHHGRDDWKHHHKCHDPDHDGDCHVIVHDHRSHHDDDDDDDRDDNRWHHDDDRDNDYNDNNRDRYRNYNYHNYNN